MYAGDFIQFKGRVGIVVEFLNENDEDRAIVDLVNEFGETVERLNVRAKSISLAAEDDIPSSRKN